MRRPARAAATLVLLALELGCATAAAVRRDTRARKPQIEQAIADAAPAGVDERLNRRFFAIMLDDLADPGHAQPSENAPQAEHREATLAALHVAFEERVGMAPVEVVREAQRRAAARAAVPDAPSFTEALAVLAAIEQPRKNVPDGFDEVTARSFALLESRLRKTAEPVLQAAGAPAVSVALEPAVGASASAVLVSQEKDGDMLPVPIVGVLLEGFERIPGQLGIGVAAEIHVGPEAVLIAQSDDQLACLVGHELAHLLLGHPSTALWIGHGEALVGTLGQAPVEGVPGAGLLFGALVPTRQLVGEALVKMPIRIAGYDRMREFDADRLGQEIAADAGFDPRACAELLVETARHARSTALSAGRPTGTAPPYWLGHPPSAERVLAMTERAEELSGQPAAPSP